MAEVFEDNLTHWVHNHPHLHDVLKLLRSDKFAEWEKNISHWQDVLDPGLSCMMLLLSPFPPFKVKIDNLFCLNFVIMIKWHHSLLNWSPISPVFTMLFSFFRSRLFTQTHDKKASISQAEECLKQCCCLSKHERPVVTSLSLLKRQRLIAEK